MMIQYMTACLPDSHYSLTRSPRVLYTPLHNSIHPIPSLANPLLLSKPNSLLHSNRKLLIQLLKTLITR